MVHIVGFLPISFIVCGWHEDDSSAVTRARHALDTFGPNRLHSHLVIDYSWLG